MLAVTILFDLETMDGTGEMGGVMVDIGVDKEGGGTFSIEFSNLTFVDSTFSTPTAFDMLR
tara:strand:+ start:2589 stop:2771 length:183 start_codon:yes stop_codon:yes gene_type:complete